MSMVRFFSSMPIFHLCFFLRALRPCLCFCFPGAIVARNWYSCQVHCSPLCVAPRQHDNAPTITQETHQAAKKTHEL